MSRIAPLVAALAAAIAITGCSNNQRTDKSSPGQPTVGTGGAGANLKEDDDFVREIAQSNMALIALSRTAVEKATSADIKSFAQRVIDEHSMAETRLKGALAGNAIQWPTELDDKQKESVDDLTKKQGADFDREYAAAIVEAHQNFVGKLESRLDVQSLAEWKTAAAGRAHSKAMPDPSAMRDVQVRPASSGNAATTKINQWAAETYAAAQKHLDTATTLETTIKKRSD